MDGERIAKVIARAGVCSRRDAERLITDGRVTLNGSKMDTPAINVTAEDVVEVDGKPIPVAQKPRLWRYHKPAGLVVTNRDPEGRPTIFDRLPKNLPRVLSIGRLDINSEGLLLLTNDGELARKLEMPATGWIRRYRVKVRGTPDSNALASLADGITLDGTRYRPIEAKVERTLSGTAWVSFALKEGRNREIRRVCDHLDIKVIRLVRTSYGPFNLGNLARNEVKEVPSRIVAKHIPF